MKFLSTFAMAMMAIGFAASTPASVAHLAIRGDSLTDCSASFDGPFQASIVDLDKADSQSLKKRATCGSGSQLMVTLSNGVLTDATGRTGYIASNYQLQFDAPPQHGTLVDSGFSVCANGSLAIGDSAVFYQCTSGTFSNLYDRWWADQCSPVNLQAMPCGDVESIADAPAGKVVGTQMVQTTLVTVLKDGQPQVVPTVVPIAICQIDDGQIQGHTTPCAELPAPKPSAPAPPSPGSPEAAPSAPATAPAETTPATTVAPPASSSEPTPTDVAAGAARTSGVALVALVIGMAAAML